MMDEIDRKLLARLQEDATVPTADLADHAGLSATPVWNTAGDVVYPGWPVSDLSTSSTEPLAGGGIDAWTTGVAPPTSLNAREPWGNGGFSPAPIGWQFTDHVIQNLVALDPTYNFRDTPVSREGANKLFSGSKLLSKSSSTDVTSIIKILRRPALTKSAHCAT